MQITLTNLDLGAIDLILKGFELLPHGQVKNLDAFIRMQVDQQIAAGQAAAQQPKKSDADQPGEQA